MTRTQIVVAHGAALALALLGMALWEVYGLPIALISAFMLC